MPSILFDRESTSSAMAVNAKVIDALQMGSGLVHAEYKRTDAGAIHLMEVAARTPGDGLLTMYELSTGAPLERAVIRIATGVADEYPEPVRFSRQVYVDVPPGTLAAARVEGFDVEVTYPGDPPARRASTRPGDPPAVRELRMEKRCGEQFRRAETAEERLGSVIFDAPDLARLDELEAQLARGLHIESIV